MQRNKRAKRVLGERAEGLVCDHLEGRGFSILGRNVRVGARELDIVARRGELVVFCEVRSRSRAEGISPLETIGPAKVRNVREAARRWLFERGLRRLAVRFDAAAVVFDVPDGRLEYVEDAF